MNTASLAECNNAMGATDGRTQCSEVEYFWTNVFPTLSAEQRHEIGRQVWRQRSPRPSAALSSDIINAVIDAPDGQGTEYNITEPVFWSVIVPRLRPKSRIELAKRMRPLSKPEMQAVTAHMLRELSIRNRSLWRRICLWLRIGDVYYGPSWTWEDWAQLAALCFAVCLLVSVLGFAAWMFFTGRLS